MAERDTAKCASCRSWACLGSSSAATEKADPSADDACGFVERHVGQEFRRAHDALGDEVVGAVVRSAGGRLARACSSARRCSMRGSSPFTPSASGELKRSRSLLVDGVHQRGEGMSTECPFDEAKVLVVFLRHRDGVRVLGEVRRERRLALSELLPVHAAGVHLLLDGLKVLRNQVGRKA